MRNEQGNPISADKIPPTASAISTRGSQGVITKSRAQLALESQERCDLAEKEHNKKNGFKRTKQKSFSRGKKMTHRLLTSFCDRYVNHDILKNS